MPWKRSVVRIALLVLAVGLLVLFVVGRIREHHHRRTCIRPIGEVGAQCMRSWDGVSSPAMCPRGFRFARSVHCPSGHAFEVYSLFEHQTCGYDGTGELVFASHCTDVVHPYCGPCMSTGEPPRCEFEPNGVPCPERPEK
jgi:hypothetical protein